MSLIIIQLLFNGFLTSRADGGWSSWTRDEKTCSLTCGPGTRLVIKSRQCNIIAPSYGRDCEGFRINFITESCETVPCPTKSKALVRGTEVDGGWSCWMFKKTECSVTCGKGTRGKTKTCKCNNPIPQNGGKSCKGKNTSQVADVVGEEAVNNSGEEAFNNSGEEAANNSGNVAPAQTKKEDLQKSYSDFQTLYLYIITGLFGAVAVTVISILALLKWMQNRERPEKNMEHPLCEKKMDKDFIAYDNPVTQIEKH